MTKNKYYVVVKGVKTGLFHSWEEVEPLVKGFPGAVHKGFTTKEAAQAFAKENALEKSGNAPEQPKKKQPAQKFYAVAKGHHPGIYNSYAQVLKEITGFPNPKHQSFKTQEEAKAYLKKFKTKSDTEKQPQAVKMESLRTPKLRRINHDKIPQYKNRSKEEQQAFKDAIREIAAKLTKEK